MPPQNDREDGTAVLSRDETDFREPEEFRVILLNDDYTTMEFVVSVVMTVFRKTFADATFIMLDVHRKGKGIVGTYTYDIAVTKLAQVRELARLNEFPLKCIMERV